MARIVSTKNSGKQAEKQALDYLTKQGLFLLEANYHKRCGEIDLIMQDKEDIVFVEVRLRSSNDFGGGVASVTKTKQQKIIKTATLYMQAHHLLNKKNCRFDVISIKPISEKLDIEWIKNAFY